MVTLCTRQSHRVTKMAGTMTDTDELAALHRSTNARVAALLRAATTDGREISAPARKAHQAKFETSHYCKVCKKDFVIDPAWPAEQRARAVTAHKTAHYTILAQISVLARAASAKLAVQAESAEAELAELDGA